MTSSKPWLQLAPATRPMTLAGVSRRQHKILVLSRVFVDGGHTILLGELPCLGWRSKPCRTAPEPRRGHLTSEGGDPEIDRNVEMQPRSCGCLFTTTVTLLTRQRAEYITIVVALGNSKSKWWITNSGLPQFRPFYVRSSTHHSSDCAGGDQRSSDLNDIPRSDAAIMHSTQLESFLREMGESCDGPTPSEHGCLRKSCPAQSNWLDEPETSQVRRAETDCAFAALVNFACQGVGVAFGFVLSSTNSCPSNMEPFH